MPIDISDPSARQSLLTLEHPLEHDPSWERPEPLSKRQMRQFEIGSRERMALFAAALRDYATVASEHLEDFALHRVAVATKLGNGGNVRAADEPAIHKAAKEIAKRYGSQLAADAAQLPDSEWALCVGWVRGGKFDDMLPAPIERLGTPTATAIAELIRGYGFRANPTGAPDLMGPAGSVVSPLAHCPLDGSRWHVTYWRTVQMEQTLGASVGMMPVRQQVDPPISAPWRAAYQAALPIMDLDILLATRGLHLREQTP